MSVLLKETFWFHFQNLSSKPEFDSVVKSVVMQSQQRRRYSPCVMFLTGGMMATMWKEAGVNLEEEQAIDLTMEALFRWIEEKRT